MSRTKQYTAAEVVAAIQETKGMVYLAAKKLGCSHTTVYNYLKNYVTVRNALDAERGELIDIMELKLREAALDGQPWALQFGLRTIGRHRGYVERSEQEITGKDGGPVRVKHAIDSETAETIFDILAAAGAIPTAPDEPEDDDVHTAPADAEASGIPAAAPD